MDTTLLPILLCLVSAVTLAVCNVLVKKGGDVLTSRMLVSFFMGVSVLPFAPFVPGVPVEQWPLMALCLGVHWAYQFCMVRALHRGELSLVFPVMRGLAPLATAIFAIFYLQEALSGWQMVGLLLACTAIVVFAVPTGTTLDARKVDRSALFWAVMAAVGIGGYSVVDAQASRSFPSAGTFAVYLFLLDWIGITVVTLIQRRGRAFIAIRSQLRDSIIAGVAGSFSYAAAIFAFSMTNAANVSALRETSVVFAAGLGALLLKEGFGARRTLAASILACGLVLMQVSGG